MAQQKLTEAEAVRGFWDHLDHGTTVMLGINAAAAHTQPMTAFGEPAEEQIWFFTRDDTDIAQEAASGCEARLILVAKDQEVFADVLGALAVARDVNRIARYWNAMVAAWYPGGKDDPHLTLMCFTPRLGQVWVSKQGLMSVAFQVAKANLTKTLPDVGGSADVTFRH